MILQSGNTIKASIELPVATRHRRDVTKKLLIATLNQNKQTNFIYDYNKSTFLFYGESLVCHKQAYSIKFRNKLNKKSVERAVNAINVDIASRYDGLKT